VLWTWQARGTSSSIEVVRIRISWISLQPEQSELVFTLDRGTGNLIQWKREDRESLAGLGLENRFRDEPDTIAQVRPTPSQ
jgi:hypothetical protein